MMTTVKKLLKNFVSTNDNAPLEEEFDFSNLHFTNNYGIEVREVSFVDYERRKIPRLIGGSLIIELYS